MQLAVDASILVGESLRARGKWLLSHPELDLVVATEGWSETQHELSRRIQAMAVRSHMTAAESGVFLAEALGAVALVTTVAPPDVYEGRLPEATLRVPQDENDAPTVALALALDCGIWTSDRDFFGCGVAVWSTDVLLRSLPPSS